MMPKSSKKSKKQVLSESSSSDSSSDASSSSADDEQLMMKIAKLKRKRKLSQKKKQKRSKKISQEVRRSDGSVAKRMVTKYVEDEGDGEIEPLVMITTGRQLSKVRGGVTHLSKDEFPEDTLVHIKHISNTEMKNGVLAVYCDLQVLCQYDNEKECIIYKDYKTFDGHPMSDSIHCSAPPSAKQAFLSGQLQNVVEHPDRYTCNYCFRNNELTEIFFLQDNTSYFVSPTDVELFQAASDRHREYFFIEFPYVHKAKVSFTGVPALDLPTFKKLIKKATSKKKTC